MTRVLLADDQAPDPKMHHLSDAELRQRCLEEYKDLLVKFPDKEKEDFAGGFVFLRKLVKQLQERGYTVDCATSPEEATEKAKSNVYNAIILDLGWFTLKTKSHDEKMLLGWDIADVLRQYQSAPILMFSNRFLQDTQRAQTTAEKGLLPVYKTSDEACANHLLVTVRWAASSMSAAEMLEQQRKRWKLLDEQEQSLTERKQRLSSFETHQRFSGLLLGVSVLSAVLITVTFVFTLLWPDRSIANTTLVIGLLTSLISNLAFVMRLFQRNPVSVPPTRRVQKS